MRRDDSVHRFQFFAMKSHFNAKLCFILLFGCAYVCQTYTVDKVEEVSSPLEEYHLHTDSPKTITIEKPAEHTAEIFSSAPEEYDPNTDNSQTVPTETAAEGVPAKIEEIAVTAVPNRQTILKRFRPLYVSTPGFG